MYFQVHTRLDGITLLCEIILGARGSRGHGKGIIACVGQIATPQADAEPPEVGIGMGAKHSIHVLSAGVGLVPP